MNLATDTNGNPIQALRPDLAGNVTDSTYPVAESGILRMTATSANAAYAIGGPTGTHLPVGVVEYIRVFEGDILLISGTINITVCG